MKIPAVISQTRTVDVAEVQILLAAAQLVEQAAGIDGFTLSKDGLLVYTLCASPSISNAGWASKEQVEAFAVVEHLHNLANKETN